MWIDGHIGHICLKSRGSGIMISDFIEEHNGFLHPNEPEMEMAKEMGLNITNLEAWHKFEYGQQREG